MTAASLGNVVLTRRSFCLCFVASGYFFNDLAEGRVVPDQPDFALRIVMSGRGGHVVVNDVPVFRNYSSMPATLQIPVTEFMLNGDNSFGFDLFADEEQSLSKDARVSAELILRRSGVPPEEGTVVADIKMDGSFAAAAGRPYPAFDSPFGRVDQALFLNDRSAGILRLRRPLHSLVRLPEWQWSRGEPIADTEDMRAGLEKAYRDLWDALAGKRGQDLERLLDEKAKEIAAAYYISRSEALDIIELPAKPFDSGWTLEKPRWEATAMELAAGGRLARLTYRGGAAPIVYHDSDRNFHTFDMWWRRERGQWILTR